MNKWCHAEVNQTYLTCVFIKFIFGMTKVSGQVPHITTEYSEAIRNRTTLARGCLNVQKPKPQASEKIIYRNSLTVWCLQYNTQKDGGMAVTMAVLPPPSKKPITLPCQRGFIEGGKKEENTKPSTKLLKGEEWVTGRLGLRL